MKSKRKIKITREITESATVYINSATEAEAFDKISEGMHDGTLDPEWKIDVETCGQEPFYITEISES